jgi:ergothioneine biosynthesis protein EgtB
LSLVSIPSLRQEITQNLQQCRQYTLELASKLDRTTLTNQAHPDFSPIGWHLGHIAFTEAYWILEHLQGYSSLFPQYRQLFAADGLPKAQRQNLPPLETIQDYLDTVRSQVLEYLQTAPVEAEERLWRWLLQHESQHCETVCLILQLHNSGYPFSFPAKIEIDRNLSTTIEISAGEFIMGSNKREAQDNERPAHQVYLNTYYLDRYLVTCRQYRQFMEAAGYQNPKYWSPEGWQWLQTNPVSQPLYWVDSPEYFDRPVCGVNYYEAEAYAKFVGKRLPTEAEWEKAACIDRCKNMFGYVWQWTNSWFDAYPGFSSYPYRGYSQAYFDRQHRVLKGGSWATSTWTLRPSFRNWYHPWVRQIFAGFRCASYL